MNIREFRTGLKEAFNRAESGEQVEIERKGVVYTLSKQGKDVYTPAPIIIKQKEDVYTNIPNKDTRVYTFCKHGAEPSMCKQSQPGKLCK